MHDRLATEIGGTDLALEKIEAPMGGRITDVRVSAGSRVKQGDVICILESMKMENPILSPVSGVVSAVHVSVPQVVKTGVLMAVIEY
ncbi:MAG: biotin/lipoyl-binding protein [Chloroflexi bacterium]|nr:biotin/lipoyl-binding protein [Chloroflexota bacterium]